MREPSSHLGAGLEKQSIWSGGDRASTARPRSDRSTYSVRTPAAIGEAPTLCGPKCGIHTRLGSSSCGDGPNEPKTHTKISPSTSSGPERCMPRIWAILRGECALCVLKDLFWFPGRFMCIGSRTPAQGAHPSAVEALGVRNADLPVGWSLPTTPSPKPYVPHSVGVRADGHGRVWVGLSSG